LAFEKPEVAGVIFQGHSKSSETRPRGSINHIIIIPISRPM